LRYPMERMDRRIDAARDQEMRDTRIIRPNPIDKQQDELIERQGEKERKTCRYENVPRVPLVALQPPLTFYRQHQKRDSHSRNRDHQNIGEDAPLRPSVAQRRIQPAYIIAWSCWRRAHQAAARRAHIKIQNATVMPSANLHLFAYFGEDDLNSKPGMIVG